MFFFSFFFNLGLWLFVHGLVGSREEGLDELGVIDRLQAIGIDVLRCWQIKPQQWAPL